MANPRIGGTMPPEHARVDERAGRAAVLEAASATGGEAWMASNASN